MTRSRPIGILLTECVALEVVAPHQYAHQTITLPVSRIAKVTAVDPPRHVRETGANLPAAALDLREPSGHMYVKETCEEVAALMNADSGEVFVVNADFKDIEQQVMDSLRSVTEKSAIHTETGRIPRAGSDA